MSITYGVGLLDMWAIVWLAVLVIFYDARGDFKRIERAEIVQSKKEEQNEQRLEPTQDHLSKNTNGQALRNRLPNGSASPGPETTPSSTLAPSEVSPPKYAWQPLPISLSQRISWTADLVSNFRGLGWAHQITAAPSPPPSVLSTLHPSQKHTPSTVSSGVHRYGTRRSVLRKYTTTLIIGYLTLDLLKVIMMADPYFWGFTNAPPPLYLPSIIRESYVLTKTYRLLISLAGAYTALASIFALAAPFFVGLIGERYLGVRAEPWQYPDHWGNFSIVFKKGLAGFWGGWWHQTFRLAFEAPQKWAVRQLGWSDRGLPAKMLGLVVAFTCSGCLHAAGSYTMLPPTRPIRGPFMFFVLQAVGIALEMGMSQLMGRMGIREKMPMRFRLFTNFAATYMWLYYTAPLLVDDFAKGGIWLFEPIPVSPLRGLGFGAEGEGWWCWHGRLIGWHHGERWWQSGISF